MLAQSKKLDLAGWCDDLAVSLISVLIGYEGDIIELSRWCRKRGAVPSKREGKLSAPDAHQLFAGPVSQACQVLVDGGLGAEEAVPDETIERNANA